MNIETVVLAAGKGTRMRSAEMPKVMHPVAGFPMIGWIAETAAAVSDSVNIVVGYQSDRVRDFCDSLTLPVPLSFSEQNVQNGTGGAVQAALESSETTADYMLITAGDVPLVRKQTMQSLIDVCRSKQYSIALVSAVLDDPHHFGRVIRDDSDTATAIVEYADADSKQRTIREINSGIYLVHRDLLQSLLSRLDNNNAKHEYYLTDIVGLAVADGHTVGIHRENDAESLMGVNTKYQLSQIDMTVQKAMKRAFMEHGVTILAPDTVYIEKGAVIKPGVFIHPGCYISSGAHIGTDTVIGHNALIRGTVRDSTHVKPATVM